MSKAKEWVHRFADVAALYLNPPERAVVGVAEFADSK